MNGEQVTVLPFPPRLFLSQRQLPFNCHTLSCILFMFSVHQKASRLGSSISRPQSMNIAVSISSGFHHHPLPSLEGPGARLHRPVGN